jgi:hypothetical protein
MSLVPTVRRKLTTLNIPFEEGPDFIHVKPHARIRFEVSLYEVSGELIVHYEAWHEHFTDEKQALGCFTFGLGEQARLEVVSRGGVDYKWTMEYRKGDE